MNKILTLLDVRRVKQRAKQLKAEFPEERHTRRLDRATVEICRTRNFHELSKRAMHSTNQSVDTPDGPNAVSYCRYCEFSFAADLDEDIAAHCERHERYLIAEDSTNPHPGTHAERELLKKEGYRLVNHGENDEARVKGLGMIAESYFKSSYSKAIEMRRWSTHPNFNDYVAGIADQLAKIDHGLAAVLVNRRR